jgi:hypothetical protein
LPLAGISTSAGAVLSGLNQLDAHQPLAKQLWPMPKHATEQDYADNTTMAIHKSLRDLRERSASAQRQGCLARALALLQDEIEAAEGLPMFRGSR